MFRILYTYKVAILPFPVIFVTASSEVPAIFVAEAQEAVLSNIVSILDKAQKNYKAVIIANEPTENTHNLNFTKSKNAVAAYCSLQFQSVLDMHRFIEKEIQNKQ